MEILTPSIIKEPAKPSKELSIIHLDQSGKVDLTKYSPAEMEKYKNMSDQLKTTDNNSILNFGLELQNKLAGHSDAFLNNVTVKSVALQGYIFNEVHEILSNEKLLY